MSVHDGAKKILRHLLDLAIEHGNLNMQTALQYDELAKVVGLDVKMCRVCCQYLETIGAVSVVGENPPYEIEITAVGVDFLES